jgi:Flp pilus assembly CpaE family ATPase
VVLNRAAAEDEIQKKDIEDALDIKVTQVLRRDDANVMSSLNLGRPAATNGSRSRYARDVQALCTSLTVAPARGQPSGVGRLLHRLSRGKA